MLRSFQSQDVCHMFEMHDLQYESISLAYYNITVAINQLWIRPKDV